MHHSLAVHIAANHAYLGSRSISSASSPVTHFNAPLGFPSRNEVDSMDLDSSPTQSSPLSTFRVPISQFRKPSSQKSIQIPTTSHAVSISDDADSQTYPGESFLSSSISESSNLSTSLSSYGDSSDLLFRFDSPPLEKFIEPVEQSIFTMPVPEEDYYSPWSTLFSSCDFPVLLLPEEIQFHVMATLAPSDVARLGMSCRSFYIMSIAPRLWKILSKRDFQARRVGRSIDWRSYYRKIATLTKGTTAAVKLAEDAMQEDNVVAPKLITCGGMKMCESRPLGRFVQTGTAVGDKLYFIGGQITSTRRLNNVSCFDVSKTNGSLEGGSLEELNEDNKITLVNQHQYCFNSVRKGASKGMVTAEQETAGEVINEVPRFARHVAAKGKDGTIVCFGGFDGRATFFGTAIFDPIKMTWSFVKTFGEQPPLRSNSAADVVDGKFYLFGGSNDNDSGDYQILGDLWVLDLTTYMWTRLHEDVTHYQTNNIEGQIRKIKTCRVTGDLPEGRVGHRLVAIADKLYLIGGGVWSEKLGWSVQYNQMYVFDTTKNHWYTPASEIVKAPAATTGTSTDASAATDAANSAASASAHPPTVCYPFSFEYKDMLVTTTLEKKVWVFDTIAEKWYEIVISGEGSDMDIPSIAHSMGAAGVVGNQAFFLGSYHIGPGSPLNDFYRLTFNF